MVRCGRLLAGAQRRGDHVGLAPRVGERRGERVQHVDRARARLVDVDGLELGRGRVQNLQVQGRLAAGRQRLLQPDAEAVDRGRGQAEALGEVAQVRVAEAVDLDERHALALTLQPRGLQREVVVGGQVLVGGEARLRDGVGAAGRGAGPLQVARLVGGALVPGARPPCAGRPRCSTRRASMIRTAAGCPGRPRRSRRRAAPPGSARRVSGAMKVAPWGPAAAVRKLPSVVPNRRPACATFIVASANRPVTSTLTPVAPARVR